VADLARTTGAILNSNNAQSEVLKELLSLRQQIDRLDHALVLLLANRFALTQKVGELKASAGLNSVDPKREEEKLASIRKLCEAHQLNPELLTDILAQIMRETVRNHERIRAQVNQPS
jgi:chorismate mutase